MSQDSRLTRAGNTPASTVSSEPESAARRLALKRLGLAAGAAYVAPTLLSLTEADAQDGPTWQKPTKPTKPSKPKR